LTGPKIRTARLVLSPLGLVDAPRMFEYRSVAEVARYQNWVPGTVDDARHFITEFGSVAFDTPGAWSQLGISLAGAGLIGDLGVHVPLNEPLQAEIGVTLAPAHQGRGFATEAVRGLLGHLFGTLAKHRVFASVDPRNERSLALLERVGMRREAHFHKSLWFKGEWVDDVVFAILASDWQGR
jgi:RimJ/RimL family protein N-acetyltransferase